MPLRALLLALLCFVLTLPALARPQLHARATLDGPRHEPDEAGIRWLWARRSLRLGVLAQDNPPLDILGTGSAYEGITADYAGLLGEQLNLQVQVQVFEAFAEAHAALRAGEVDLLGSVTSRQALDAGLRLSRPYAEDCPLLLAREARGRERVDDTHGLDLVMVQGYRSLEQVHERYPQARVQTHLSPFDALATLALGHADLYLGNALAARYALGRGQLAGVEEVGHAGLPRQGIGFAMLNGDTPLPGLVDAALGNLTERQHQRIRERWSPLGAAAQRPVPLQLSEAEQRWLLDNPRVQVAMDEQLLPLSFRDGKGQWRGLSLDVLQLISRRTGLRFEVQAGGTLQGMLEQLREGEVQLIAGLPRSPALERQVSFSRAYLSASRVLVTRDAPQAPGNLEQLAGRPLALVWGSALHEMLGQHYPQVVPMAVASPVEALRAVARGKAAAAVLTLDDARALIARGYPGQLKISASLPLPPAHFALASARGAVELQGILDKALLSLSPHEIDGLVRRWRNPMIVADGVWQRYRGRILLGFTTALLLLGLALLWIRYLRRLQVQLRRAKREADAANQAKTQFLTTMSHELRTPLHAVQGMLELARRKAERGEFDHLALEVADEAARGLLELIGDILDITRIESGHLQFAAQRVCLREHVGRVLQLFEQQARSKGLALRLVTQGQVDAQVMLDPLRFKQVLANLLSNAIKFTEHGEVTVNLSATAVDGYLAVELTVRDTGVGIAASELAHLGQPFRQASNQCQSPRCSAGLGLGISRSLCEMMGGSLHLHSVLGQGTEVNVRLSLPQLSAAQQRPAAATGDTRHPPQPLRLLVVDDYPANRLLLVQQLEYLGHQACVAQDGTQALRLWLGEHFDGVISDCNMPRLNGYALARAIREHERRSGRPRCQVIGLTASATQVERRRCRAAGMDACLFKPLGLDGLVRALARASPALLDLEHIRRLVAGDEAALRALLADLRASNLQDLQLLAQVPANAEALAMLAHRIKGGARIARARVIVDLCERLERRCQAKPPAPGDIEQDVGALREAMLQLEQQLALHAPGSNHAEQQQHQQNHQHHANDAGWAIAPAARVWEDR